MPAYDSWKNSGAAKNGVAYKDFEGLYTPGTGTVSFDKGFIKKDNKDEVAQAEWIAKTFGGRIRLLKRSNVSKTPDYEWNGELWELKTPKGHKGADRLVHVGLKQIKENPGGIVVDCGKNNIDIEKTIEIVRNRFRRSKKSNDAVIIIKGKNDIVKIIK